MSSKERTVALLEAGLNFCVAVTKSTAEESKDEQLQYLASRLEELRAEIPRLAAG